MIKFDPSEGYIFTELPRRVEIEYFGEVVFIELQNEKNNVLSVGSVLLTKAGKELAPVCGASSCRGFLEYVLNKW